MVEAIYEWIQNISIYLIVMAAVMHAIPGKDYGKYVRFFSGLVLILLLASPLMKLTGTADDFRALYRGKEYEMERKEIERAEEIYEQSGLSEFMDGYSDEGTMTEENRENGPGQIEVEEIRIGE